MSDDVAMAKRKKIPKSTKEVVLLEACYMCGNPICRETLTLELHHIDWVRDGGGNTPENLIALCANCHERHTRGHIPKEAIRVWKSMLVSLNSVNRTNIDTLLYLHRMENHTFGSHLRYSADTLIHLAGLMNAGLIEIGSASAGTGFVGSDPHGVIELELTSKGRAIVDAWLSGDEKKYNVALAFQSNQ